MNSELTETTAQPGWRMSGIRRRTSGLVLVVALLSAACSGAGGSEVDESVDGQTAASPASQSPVVSSFDGFAAEQCAALQALFRAYGNLDTAGLSPLMRSFSDAIERADATTAAEKAREIRLELENGRAHARSAAGWAPAGVAMAQLDRILVAVEKMVQARVAAMAKGPTAAEQEGQAAFEAAGGIEAWFGWIKSLEELGALPGGVRPLPKCEGVPIG